MAWVGVLNPWSHNTLSAWPPLENIARLCLKYPERLPTAWIGGLIRATSVTPDVGWLDYGETLMYAAHRPREGAAALQESIALKPREPLPYYHLGIALDMDRRPHEAIGVYRKLLELDPQNVGGWNNLGIFALRAGDLALAKEAYGKSDELAPGNATAAWGALVVGGMEGKPDFEKMKEALRRHPGDRRLQGLAEQWGMK